MRTVFRLSCWLRLCTCLLSVDAWDLSPILRPPPLSFLSATRPSTTREDDRYHTRDRRSFLANTRTVVRATVAFTLLSPPKQSLAASPATPAEAIRRSAANIPGYGPTDVFFPRAWVGLWHVQRQVSFGGSDKTITLDYTIRFLPSIEDDAVVADRGFNQANLEAAAGGTTLPTQQWTFTNPNDLRLAWPDGRYKDIKVTQRATDYQQVPEGRLWSSEVQRVTNDGGSNGGSVPVISARRVVTQYGWESSDNGSPNIVQALEVIYDLGDMSDPMQGASGSSRSNEILSKSRIVMQRWDTAK